MNPTRLHATNYRTFESLDLSLPVGCVAIVGENGAGKSSLVNLIELALFGGRLADHATDDSDGDLFIGLEFEHRGELYRVRRSLTRGKSPKVDFEAFSHTWQPLTKETARETDAAIAELLGLSRETFRASAFLAQGDGAAFTEAQPRERKAILAEILGLAVWDKLLARVRADKGFIEGTASRLQTTIELAESQLSERATIIAERDAAALQRDEAQKALTSAQAALRDAESTLATAREAEASVTAAGQVLAEKSRRVADAEQRLAVASERRKEIEGELANRDWLAGLAEHADELQEELKVAREVAATSAERQRLTNERGAIANKIMVFEKEHEATCDRCGQLLDAKAKQQAAMSLGYERSEIDERLAELPPVTETRPLGNIEHDLSQALVAGRQLAGLDEQEKQLRTYVAEIESLERVLPEVREELEAARKAVAELQQPVDLAALSLAVGAHRQGADDAAERVKRHEHAVTRADTRLEQLAKVEDDLREALTALEQHRSELDLLAILERAFGRDGIPALIVENAAIPQIELEANRILDELGTSFRVELRTQRALKSGEGVKEALDILVLGPGGERLYESFSGGEKTRLNLALRIALARLLAHRRGAEVRLLAIDEPEFLDEAGHERLAGVLSGLLGDFDRVLLVSHAQTLKDAFDQVIQVEKGDDGRSRIATGAPSDYAEAVAV